MAAGENEEGGRGYDGIGGEYETKLGDRRMREMCRVSL